MAGTITSPYIDCRNGGYYVSGSGVSLASVIQSFREGSSPETILQDFPQIGSLAKVYGVLTFILESPAMIESYVADQERLWNELESSRPLPPEMVRRFEERREALRRRPA